MCWAWNPSSYTYEGSGVITTEQKVAYETPRYNGKHFALKTTEKNDSQTKEYRPYAVSVRTVCVHDGQTKYIKCLFFTSLCKQTKHADFFFGVCFCSFICLSFFALFFRVVVPRGIFNLCYVFGFYLFFEYVRYDMWISCVRFTFSVCAVLFFSSFHFSFVRARRCRYVLHLNSAHKKPSRPKKQQLNIFFRVDQKMIIL